MAAQLVGNGVNGQAKTGNGQASTGNGGSAAQKASGKRVPALDLRHQANHAASLPNPPPAILVPSPNGDPPSNAHRYWSAPCTNPKRSPLNTKH